MERAGGGEIHIPYAIPTGGIGSLLAEGNLPEALEGGAVSYERGTPVIIVWVDGRLRPGVAGLASPSVEGLAASTIGVPRS